jgi:FixJ family two-component response regulator
VSEDILISIVEDGASVSDALRALVQSLGYRAATFTSAENFLKSDLIEQTVCVIADVKLPGLGGLQLQKELQSRGHRTSIIMITAYPPDEEIRTRALGAGAIGFLMKPFAEEALIKCLDTAIELHRIASRSGK